MAIGNRKGLAETVVEQFTVRKTCEGIMVCMPTNKLLRLFTFRDVCTDPYGAPAVRGQHFNVHILGQPAHLSILLPAPKLLAVTSAGPNLLSAIDVDPASIVLQTAQVPRIRIGLIRRLIQR